MPCDSDPLIRLSPSGKQFHAHPGQSVLEAGLAAGISLPYRCNNGSCGDCRARVLKGSTEAVSFHDYVLSDLEKRSGVVLLCSHRALNNLDIEVTEATSAEDIPLQQLQTRVCHRECTGGALIVRLKIIRGKALRYLAGQYATLHLPSIQPLQLPIASCPCETGYLEFHVPESHDACQIIGQLKRRERILVEGPLGTFNLDDNHLDNGEHHVFVAVGHGFAAVQPLIEHVIATEIEPRCTLLWAARTHYRDNLCRSWADAFDWLEYRKVPDVSSAANHLAQLHCNDVEQTSVYLSAAATEYDALIAALGNTRFEQWKVDELGRQCGP